MNADGKDVTMHTDKPADDSTNLAYFTGLIDAVERDGVVVFPDKVGTGLRIGIPHLLARRMTGRLLLITAPILVKVTTRELRERGGLSAGYIKGPEFREDEGAKVLVMSDRTLASFLDATPTLDGFDAVLLAGTRGDARTGAMARIEAQARLKAIRDSVRPGLKVLVAASGTDIVACTLLWYGAEALTILRERCGVTRMTPIL